MDFLLNIGFNFYTNFYTFIPIKNKGVFLTALFGFQIKISIPGIRVEGLL